MEKPSFQSCCCLDLITGVKMLVLIDVFCFIGLTLNLFLGSNDQVSTFISFIMASAAILAARGIDLGIDKPVKMYSYLKILVLTLGISVQITFFAVLESESKIQLQNDQQISVLTLTSLMLEGSFMSLSLFSKLLKIIFKINDVFVFHSMQLSIYGIFGFYFALCIYSAGVYIYLGKNQDCHFQFERTNDNFFQTFYVQGQAQQEHFNNNQQPNFQSQDQRQIPQQQFIQNHMQQNPIQNQPIPNQNVSQPQQVNAQHLLGQSYAIPTQLNPLAFSHFQQIPQIVTIPQLPQITPILVQPGYNGITFQTYQIQQPAFTTVPLAIPYSAPLQYQQPQQQNLIPFQQIIAQGEYEQSPVVGQPISCSQSEIDEFVISQQCDQYANQQFQMNCQQQSRTYQQQQPQSSSQVNRNVQQNYQQDMQNYQNNPQFTQQQQSFTRQMGGQRYQQQVPPMQQGYTYQSQIIQQPKMQRRDPQVQMQAKPNQYYYQANNQQNVQDQQSGEFQFTQVNHKMKND